MKMVTFKIIYIPLAVIKDIAEYRFTGGGGKKKKKKKRGGGGGGGKKKKYGKFLLHYTSNVNMTVHPR